jgi:hypothetical protein
MKTEKIIIAAVIALLAGSVTSSMGQALNLTSGATLEGDSTNQVLMNSGTAANDGTISTWVVSDSAVDSRGYIFVYQLENSGPDDITGVNFNNFSSPDVIGTGVYSNVYVGGTFTMPGALNVTSISTPSFAFDTVTGGGAATFNGDLAMGAESWFVVIDTDVSSFQTGYALTQDNFQAHGDILAENFAVFTVPESSSAVILLGGFACFYVILRCRRALS